MFVAARIPNPNGNLWIGSAQAAVNIEFLAANKISYIIDISNGNVANSLDIPVWRVTGFHDIESYSNIDSIIRQSIYAFSTCLTVSERIKEKIDAGDNILVHCAMGINRSALVIAAYLILYCNMSYEEALYILVNANKLRNLPVLTNEMFRRVLIVLDE